MAKQKPYSLNEYLSEHNSGEDFIFVNDIIHNLIGKAIWMEPKKHGWHYNYYTIPLYIVVNIDREKSRLIVHPIKAHALEVTHDYDYTEYTTFKYEIDTTKKKSINLGLIRPGLLKIGTSHVFTNHIKELDFDKEDKVCTYYRLYD